MITLLFLSSSFVGAQTNPYNQDSFVKKSMLDVHAGALNAKDVEQGMLFGGALVTTFDDAIDLGSLAVVLKYAWLHSIGAAAPDRIPGRTPATLPGYLDAAGPGSLGVTGRGGTDLTWNTR